MSTPVTFTCYLADGVTRNPSATPTFSGGKYVNRSNGSRTPPTINNLGLGKFSIEGTDADEAIGCAFLIATGCTPPYVFGAITTSDKPFAVVAFYTAAGALISSGTPSIPTGGYQNFAGNALTPQAVNAMGAALFSLTPLDAELEAGGVNWIIQAPIAAIPAYYDGDLIAENSSAFSTAVPAISNFVPNLATPLQPSQEIGFDVTLSDGSLFSSNLILVGFAGLDVVEAPYDGSEFSPLYSAGSYVENITNGYRFHLKRRGGWPGSPVLKVRSTSAAGKLNT